MICLRCGYCCKYLSVAIVDDPNKGIFEENIVFHDGNGKACKHLRGSKVGEYSCILHDKSWYIDTPCFAHKQFERKNCNCRMGEAVKNGKLKKVMGERRSN